MSCCFLNSSIGKKVIMSISGLFLILFLCIHLLINLFILFDSSGELYNQAAHFMATNPLIRVMEPVLAIGFIVHIIYASVLTLQNQKARSVNYASRKHRDDSWSSRNMYILGFLVLVFLFIHVMDFFYKMKIDNAEFLANDHNAYALVTSKFNGGEMINYLYAALYLIGAILLGLHMRHGFWSSFQSLGWNNAVWKKRLKDLAMFFAWIFGIGYAVIPILIIILKL